MEIADLIRSTKDYIAERIELSRRKLLLVYKNTRDEVKKNELETTFKQIDRDLQKLDQGQFEEKDLARYGISAQDLEMALEEIIHNKRGGYRILHNIPIEPVSPNTRNDEVNAIWSYLQFFGKEYLGLLSEQNLKLDYGHAYQRDQFYMLYNDVLKVVKEYGEISDQIAHAELTNNKEYRSRLIQLQNKQYRDVILRVGKFLHALQLFVQSVFSSEEEGVKSILEPDAIVMIEGSDSSLNGATAKRALQDLARFVEEFLDYIKIPDISKVEEEK
jgi:predicted RNA-binding protein Jag